MKLIKSVLFLSIFFFSSCDEGNTTLSTERAPSYYSIKDISKPEYICDFSDGRKLFRIELGYNTRYGDSHFVYFFNSSGEISINFSEKIGKHFKNKTIVQLPE